MVWWQGVSANSGEQERRAGGLPLAGGTACGSAGGEWLRWIGDSSGDCKSNDEQRLGGDGKAAVLL